MKKVPLCLFFLIIFCAGGIAYPQIKAVTSDKLSIDDVQKAIMRGNLGNIFYRDSTYNNIKLSAVDINSVVGVGVFQQNNQATAYIQFVDKAQGGRRRIVEYQLIRFNSGKWFFPGYSVFLMK